MPTMTVGELADLLVQLPRDFVVETEGCDCSGDVLSIEVDGEDRDVWLRRTSKDSGRAGSFRAGDEVGQKTPEGVVPYV